MKTVNDGFPGNLDSTYFTATDCEPFVEAKRVHYYDGNGSRRSWGAPQVTTTIVVDECDFLALHFGFSHKHRGGQAWRYYVMDKGTPTRKLWRSLTDDERQLVLDNEDKAPRWAKSPGKLRADYRKPTHTAFTGYKILRDKGDGTFSSLYDGTEWEIGKRNGEAVDPRSGSDGWGNHHHGGGFYVHKEVDSLMKLWEQRDLVPERCYEPGQYALVECECSGRQAHFSSGKVAVTYCKPVKVQSHISLEGELA